MIIFNALGEAIKRTTSVVAASSDYATTFWFRANTTASGGRRRVLFTLMDAVGPTEYVEIATGVDDDELVLTVNAGAGASSTTAFSIVTSDWTPIAYVRLGTLHSFYVNGALIGTVTLDVSTDTYAEIWMGDDGSSEETDTDIAFFREWSAILTLVQITTEWGSTTAVVTANLVTETPLAADLLDDSGNGNTWTAVGSTSFTVEPEVLNIASGSAINITALPYSNTQTVDASGITYDVWYKYTPIDSYVIGVFGFGDVSVYKPDIDVFKVPIDVPVTYLTGFNTTNKAIQLPVILGTTLFFKFTSNGGNPTPASLTVDVLRAPQGVYPSGSIFINTLSTSFDFPGIIVSGVDADDENVLTFINPIASGENGDILPPSGLILLEDIPNDDLKLYDASFNELASVAFAATVGFRIIRATVNGDKWYVGRAGDGVIKTVLTTGAFGSTSWTVTSTKVTGGIAANTAETILYHASSSTNQPVNRHNLSTDVAMTDLVAGVANYAIKDILVLSDDTILVTYRKTSVTQDAFVRHYSTAGATLDTYALGTVAQIRINRAADDPNSFWVWIQTITPFGFHIFRNIKVSDGSTLAGVQYTGYEEGIFDPVVTATPERFGVDSSCPFFLLSSGAPGGLYEIVPAKTNDTLWVTQVPEVTEDVKKPNPTIKTGDIGE